MLNKDLIKLLQTLPEDTEITISVCHYDGTSERYDEQDPKIIHNTNYAILTGEHDLYAQFDAVDSISYRTRHETIKLLQSSNTIVEV